LLSVITALLLTFIRTVFELPMSQMVLPRSGPPAPPLILRLFSHDQDGLASAIALVAMVAAGLCAALVWFPVRRFIRPAGARAGNNANEILPVATEPTP
jgi:iron(III) transport system permease protein